MRHQESKVETYKQLVVLVAYQVANLTMLVGFFILLFLLASRFGLL